MSITLFDVMLLGRLLQAAEIVCVLFGMLLAATANNLFLCSRIVLDVKAFN